MYHAKALITIKLGYFMYPEKVCDDTVQNFSVGILIVQAATFTEVNQKTCIQFPREDY